MTVSEDPVNPFVCQYCDVEQTFTQVSPGQWAVVAQHHDQCPTGRALNAANN
jgi:hypothetical protein